MDEDQWLKRASPQLSPGQSVRAIAAQQPHAAHLGALRVLPESVGDGTTQRVATP